MGSYVSGFGKKKAIWAEAMEPIELLSEDEERRDLEGT